MSVILNVAFPSVGTSKHLSVGPGGSSGVRLRVGEKFCPLVIHIPITAVSKVPIIAPCMYKFIPYKALERIVGLWVGLGAEYHHYLLNCSLMHLKNLIKS